jgi:hypothetical protein
MKRRRKLTSHLLGCFGISHKKPGQRTLRQGSANRSCQIAHQSALGRHDSMVISPEYKLVLTVTSPEDRDETHSHCNCPYAVVDITIGWTEVLGRNANNILRAE